MNATSRTDRKSGDARVAGISRSPFLRLPVRLNFLGQEKNQELLLPAASDCAWSGAIAKDQRGKLDGERLAGFNQSADPSTYRRKNSVRTTRATAYKGWESAFAQHCIVAMPLGFLSRGRWQARLESRPGKVDLSSSRVEKKEQCSVPKTHRRSARARRKATNASARRPAIKPTRAWRSCTTTTTPKAPRRWVTDSSTGR